MISLELGQTPTFPNGSAARSHVLRLPLNDEGMIDEQAYRAHAELATVRRFWPNEPDRHGRLLRTEAGWTLKYAPTQGDLERLFRLNAHAILPGSTITLTEADGVSLPYLVKTLATA